MTLRARLATLGILAFIALLAAAASVLLIARTTDQQRVDRAQESLVETLEIMRERLDDEKPPHAGRLGFSGVITARAGPAGSSLPISARDGTPCETGRCARAPRPSSRWSWSPRGSRCPREVPCACARASR